MLRAGCFPATDKVDDLRYSVYSRLFEDVEAACEASRRKLSNSGNRMLNPFMALRGYEAEGGDDT
jgi:hypothetical protein